MEELKQLIREDKELLNMVDRDVKELRDILSSIKDVLALFPPFFERQDRFMETMENLIGEQDDARRDE